MGQDQIKKPSEDKVQGKLSDGKGLDESEVLGKVEKFKKSLAVGEKYGYKIREEGGKNVVTLPENNEEVTLEKGESVLVINGDSEYRWVVEDPEDVISAINKFKDDKGFSVVLIEDLATGKTVSKPGEIDTQAAVLFLDIRRHNKAGK